MTVPSTLRFSLSRAGAAGRLVDAQCRAGRRDRACPERHDGWTLAVVRRGTFSYRAADTNARYALRPGWLLLGRHSETYECSHDHDGGDDCLALDFAPDVVEEVARATPGCRGAYFPAPVMGPSTRVVSLMNRLRAGADDFDEAVYRIASALLIHAHATGAAPVPPYAIQRAQVEAALSRIEQASHEPLSLGQLAASAGLSPYHFLRVFLRVTGTTPHQYLVGARIRAATRLLLDTSLSVTAIAGEVGFTDLSNFVRTFRRSIGCSPREFRRRR